MTIFRQKWPFFNQKWPNFSSVRNQYWKWFQYPIISIPILEIFDSQYFHFQYWKFFYFQLFPFPILEIIGIDWKYWIWMENWNWMEIFPIIFDLTRFNIENHLQNHQNRVFGLWFTLEKCFYVIFWSFWKNRFFGPELR